MKKGFSNFEFYLAQIQTLFKKAAPQENPALWLYQNNLRTPLFMLEALARIYSHTHHKKIFNNLKLHVKQLEDALGAIDYYDAFAKEFALNKKIPKAVVKYMQGQAMVKTKELNELLIKEKWMGKKADKIKKIQKKLSKINWLNEAEEVNALNEFYGASIYTIAKFIKKDKLHFENIETDVHELRRKLRWLSIYPQAVLGNIQLSKTNTSPKQLHKYLTQEIITSPFNKMPQANNCKYFLLLNQNYFYALSWMIAELGKLKDSGLRIIAIKEALLQLNKSTNKKALQLTYTYLGNLQPTLLQILLQAQVVCTTYFNENNLEHLVIGVAEVK